MRIFCTGMTDIGNRRGVNQDAIGMHSDGRKGLFIVADGMGGHDDGELASHHIVTKMARFWKEWQGMPEMNLHAVVGKLKDELMEENRFIFEELNVGKVCGTTLVILLVDEMEIAIISIGDSRIYVNESGKAVSITLDDIWDNLPDVKTRYSASQKSAHPNHGKLTQAYGSKADIELHIQIGKLQNETNFLLVSDGIYQYCEQESMDRCIARIDQINEQGRAIKELVDEVVRNGAKDNYSCIAVTLKKDVVNG